MRVSVRTRSGRELVPGGLEVDDQVRPPRRSAAWAALRGRGAAVPRRPVVPVAEAALGLGPLSQSLMACLPCPQATVHDLQLALQRAKPGARFHPTRQRLTVPGSAGGKPTPLSSAKRLAEYGLADGSVVSHKDLGMQARRPCAPPGMSLPTGVLQKRKARAAAASWHPSSCAPS